MEEIERKNARLGTLPEKSPVECHSVRLPPSLKLFSGYSTCSEPLETKKAADTTTQPAQKIDNMTNSMTTKHTHMLLAEKKMEEIERRNARLGTLPGESPVECQVHQVVEPNPPLQLEMARFDKTEKTERFVNQTATARSLMNLILETTSAVKAFKGSGNTFIKLPAVAINASIKNYFEIIVWHLTPRWIIIFMGSDPGKIISSPKTIFAGFDLCRKYMVVA